MPGKVAKIGTFSDWVGLFDEWRKEIGVDRDEIASFKFDTLYGAIETEEIQFGSYKGRHKWENLERARGSALRVSVQTEPGARVAGNPTELRWTFGDNTSQSGGLVTKSWPAAGTYIVTLTATNSEGTDTTQIPITVFDKVVPPTALIEASGNSATVGQTISLFSRSSGNATDLKWDFGDRSTGSGSSIRHAWSTPGTYNVTLTASNSAGSSTATLAIAIRERVLPPVARLSASASLVEEGESVRFTSLSINNPTSTTWDFGDGQSGSGSTVVKAWNSAGPLLWRRWGRWSNWNHPATISPRWTGWVS